MGKKELISFVIPCYNSTDTLPIVVQEITETMKEKMNQYDYEIILVNDCSPDGTTFSAIQKLGETDYHVRGLNLARNFGQPSAVMAGMSYAKGDYIVCGDDDGQTPFCDLPVFFDKINEGYDIVEAKYAQHEKKSLFRKLGTFMNEGMAIWLINKPKGIVLTTYWVLRRYVADEMLKYPNSYPYLGGLMMRATRNVCNVDITHRERLSGKSGYSLSKLLGLWMNGFTSFSVKPLRIATICGCMVSFLGIVLGIYTIVKKFLDPSILSGYSSTLAVILFLFGMLFIWLGVLGEYIGRIYISLNNAPQFVIKESVNIERRENVSDN